MTAPTVDTTPAIEPPVVDADASFLADFNDTFGSSVSDTDIGATPTGWRSQP